MNGVDADVTDQDLMRRLGSNLREYTSNIDEVRLNIIS